MTWYDKLYKMENTSYYTSRSSTHPWLGSIEKRRTEFSFVEIAIGGGGDTRETNSIDFWKFKEIWCINYK